MEVSEEDVWDCRDRYNELRPEVPRPTPKVLNDEQLLDIQKAKEMKLLQDCDPETWKKYMRGELAIDKDEDRHRFDNNCKRAATVMNYFSTVPADAASVSKYATEGADLLIQSMKAEGVNGAEQARMLHSAMSSILSTHRQQKRSLTRLMRRADSTADADHVVNAMVDAVVDAADLKDKKWMQMLAIGAVGKSVRESIGAQTAGAVEFRTMEKIMQRFS